MSSIYRISHGDDYCLIDHEGISSQHPGNHKFSIAKKLFTYGGAIVGYVIGALLFIPITVTLFALGILQGGGDLPQKTQAIAKLDRLAQQFLMNLPDGIGGKAIEVGHIDGLSLYPEHMAIQPVEEQKWAIMIGDPKDAYECNLEKYAAYAKEKDVAVVAFNWEGVGRSGGEIGEPVDRIGWGCAIVQSLFERGVLPENITLIDSSREATVAKTIGETTGTKVVQDPSFRQVDREGQGIQEYIGRYVALPSQRADVEELERLRRQFFEHPPEELNVGRREIPTAGGKNLDGVTLCYPPMRGKKWLIMMTGRRGNYEMNLSRYAAYAKEMGVGVLAFNWKGVGESEGATLDADSMIEDGNGAVQSLLDDGVSPEDICIIGHSLGGAVAVKVARQQGVNVVSDRSFGSSMDVVSTHLNWFPGIKSGLSLLAKLWWNLNPVDDFLEISGFKGIIYSQDDPVIPYHRSSLYKQVKDHTEEKPEYRMRIYAKEEVATHATAIPAIVMKQFLLPFLSGEYKTQVYNGDVKGITYVNPEKQFTLAKALFFSGAVIGYSVGVALFIPITITLVAIGAIMGWSLQDFVAYAAMPALREDIAELDRQKTEALNNKPSTIEVRDVNIQGLDGVTCESKALSEDPAKQRWIVMLKGRRGGYEHRLKEAMEYAEDMGVGILVANYKGVGKSQGKTLSSDSMVEDGEAMVQYLQDRGVPLENIVVYGSSLGASIAVQVAHRKEMACVADRGIASLTAWVKSLYGIRWLPGVISLISLIEKHWWKLDVTEKFKALKKHKKIIYSKQDGIIPYSKGSMHSAIQEQGIALNICVDKSASYSDKLRSSARAHGYCIPRRTLRKSLQPWISHRRTPQIEL